MIDLYSSPELIAKWAEWKEYRVDEKRQKKYNDKGEARALKRLKRLSKGDEAIAIQMLDEAMELQYIGFFEPKGKPNAARPDQSNGKSSSSDDKITALSNW